LDSKRFAALKGRIAGGDVNNCDQFRETYEAYALGALDAGERAALEAHLATGCRDCAEAIEEARWLASQLAHLAPEATPSDRLKGRLMQTVRAEAQAARQAGPSLLRISFWMWAGVAALLVLSAYSTYEIRLTQAEIEMLRHQAAIMRQEREETERQLIEAKREAVILTDPASVKISLVSGNTQTPQLEAQWHSQLGIVLTGEKIAPPPGNRVLQLWLIPKAPGGKPVPSLTVRPDADGKFVLLVSNPPELLAATKALAITEEPAGGSPQPTTPPRWVGGVG
jgi:anti-sigma-K factor RskA